MIRQFELVDLVKSYDPSADEEALNRAYVFAMRAHGQQKRASGDAYFSHPLEVAGILTNYKMDCASIITALLHDVIEDTPATLKSITALFGKEISRLVNGVTKLTRIENQSDHAKQAENFRKLLLAMSEDIRVLLVKLADRLHNMRTLHHIKNAEKRMRIAEETSDIYAPLAERIGMQEMKSELEDLAFAELNPDARNSIIARLNFLRKEGKSLIPNITEQLEKKLACVNGEISGREKAPHSIWRKMQVQNIGFEQLSDVMAFRAIVDTQEDCYKALGIVHSAYPAIPERFKDYISTPKANGYRSLHTSVLGPEQHRTEIQIRTREMHETAEYGVAAHWKFKQDAHRSDGKQYRWIKELLEILDHASGPEEFLEHTKLEMFHDKVFCFTPRGEVINLPHGATPVDFAYAVHSEIGNHCVGAKINGRMMPLRTELANGDQVDIVTSKAQTPSPDWESFLATGKARANVRKFVREEQRQQYIKLGQAILKRAFKSEDYEYANKALEGVLGIFDAATVADLCANVGSGHLTGRQVLEAVFPALKGKENVVSLANARSGKKNNNGRNKVPITGLIPGMALHVASCCHPLPGDRIVGIITSGEGVTIHTIDCELLESYADTPERWLDVSWEKDSGQAEVHVGRVHLSVHNTPGNLGTLATIIAKNGANISNLKITNRTPEFFDLLIDIEVMNAKHLTNIIATLRATPAINSVERARG
jgi:GTP diphosphokinase / guanosine-3',5'-bis(diphosphate) 3'-diphosphatase